MRGCLRPGCSDESQAIPPQAIILPSFEEVTSHKRQFARATKIIHQETNPLNARRLVQFHDRQAVVCNPPPLPVSQDDMDRILRASLHPRAASDLPGAKDSGLRGGQKDSVTLMREVLRRLQFCSITAHQGRIIQSRSPESVLDELKKMGRERSFSGVVSGPGRADGQHVPDEVQQARGRGQVQARFSCVHPTICKLLDAGHGQ